MTYKPGNPVVRVRQQVNLPTRPYQRQMVLPQQQLMKRVVRQEKITQTRTVHQAPPSPVLPQKPHMPPSVAHVKPHSIQPQKTSRPPLRPQPIQRINQKKVTYKTADISLEHLHKIQRIQNSKAGKILVVVGNGPSIMEVRLQDLKNHPDLEMVMINKPDDRIWPTDHWAFFDVSQIRRHAEYWDSYEGTLFNSTAIKKEKPSTVMFKNLGGNGFSFDLDKGLHIGRSSVYAAMQIALWMNYDKVFIFGCDMNPNGIDGKLHFYGTNPDVNPETRKERFKAEAQYYDDAANKMTDEQRSRFYFCSSYNHWGFIKKYKYLDHKEAVSFILRP